MYNILGQVECGEGDRVMLYRCPAGIEAEVDFNACLLDYKVFEEMDSNHGDKPQFTLYLIGSGPLGSQSSGALITNPTFGTTYTGTANDKYVSCAINVSSPFDKQVKHMDMELNGSSGEVEIYTKDEVKVTFQVIVSGLDVTIMLPVGLPGGYTASLYQMQFYTHSDKDVLYIHSVTKVGEPIRCPNIKMNEGDVLAVKTRNARFSFHVWGEVIQYNKDTWFEMIRDNRIATNAQLVIMNTRLSDIKTAIDQFSIQSATNTSNIVSAIGNISACSG